MRISTAYTGIGVPLILILRGEFSLSARLVDGNGEKPIFDFTKAYHLIGAVEN